MSNERFFLQVGSIPDGITASGSKYPINSSSVSIDNPNFAFGPTQTPLLSFLRLTENFQLIIGGDWSGKIKPKDPIKIKRGSIENEYEISQVIYYPLTSYTSISLTNKNDTVNLLDSFIGASGFPFPSNDTYLELGRKIESPNYYQNKVKDFSVKMIAENNESYSINVSWETDPSISATRLRWRSIPRNYNVSELSFSILSQGDYSKIPDLEIVSSSGRLAKASATVSLKNIDIVEMGSSYSYASAYADGGGGTGASFSVSLTGSGVLSINTVSGGTGYDSIPQIIIVGDGQNAKAEVSEISLSGIKLLQQGGNYLSPPSILISSEFLTGATPSVISADLNLLNEGRIDYIRLVSGGYGYTGASVSISGGIEQAIAEAEIKDGSISSIRLLYGGYGYTASNVSIVPTGTGGTGAVAVANIDIFSQWVYENPLYTEKTKIISGLKYNIPYQIEILASTDSRFRGITKYSNAHYFQYVKN